MTLPARTFLDLGSPESDPTRAAVSILPLPYEGAVSYGKGAALGPAAVIEASGAKLIEPIFRLLVACDGAS